MPHHNPRRRLAAAAAMLLVGFAAASGAGTLPAAQAEDAKDKLILVLDSSGSMKEKASGGETKIVAAKKALNQVIAQLPKDQQVGLRVFGAKVFDSTRPGACTDTQLKVPVATGNRPALKDAIASYKPYGETPIGNALKGAGQDLGSEGKRSIVLVSDGEPTCQPDPCVVAKELGRKGINVRIDVVGLDVNSKARSALQCIARAGHGVYYDVNNSKDFADSLIKVAERAARPYAAIGTPVEGTATAENAPMISNGDWADATNGETDRFYTVERDVPGSTVTVSAAFRDPDTAVANAVNLSTPEGISCGTNVGVSVVARNTLVSAAATAGPVQSTTTYDAKAPCAAADTLIAKVSYQGKTNGVPVELRVTEVPPVENFDALPQAPSDSTYTAPAATAPKPATGGTSFADATPVTPGSYRGTIVAGETLTYKVPLEWGQTLSARVKVNKLDKAHEAAARDIPQMKIEAFSPARAPVHATSNIGPSLSSEAALFPTGLELATSSGPINFRNVKSTAPGLRDADGAGDYTVTVFLGQNGESGQSIPVPFQLDLGVSGTAVASPEFAQEPVAPEDEGQPSASSKKSASSAANDAAETEGGFPTAAVVGGLGVLALLAAAGIAMKARAGR